MDESTPSENTNEQRRKIAHELNNVMMIIGTTADAILDLAQENPELGKIGERLDRAAKKGAELANQLRALESKF